MRSENEIKKTILDFASKDNRIRAVVLNGSRADPAIVADKYQDFDVVFVVRDFNTFLTDKNWLSFLGKPILQQFPDEMILGSEEKREKISYAYLMIFEDGNRIDLTLFPIEKFSTTFVLDSLTIVWMDKDNLFKNTNESNDRDYHIRKPGERYFIETCNEFWWLSTYVAKGLLRNEITYAKEMLETAVRPMFMKLIEWKIGVENNFSVSFGKAGKHMKKYLTDADYHKVLSTYTGHDIEDNWKALFTMMDIFEELSNKLASEFNFDHNKTEQVNAMKYVKQLYNEGK